MRDLTGKIGVIGGERAQRTYHTLDSWVSSSRQRNLPQTLQMIHFK